MAKKAMVHILPEIDQPSPGTNKFDWPHLRTCQITQEVFEKTLSWHGQCAYNEGFADLDTEHDAVLLDSPVGAGMYVVISADDACFDEFVSFTGVTICDDAAMADYDKAGSKPMQPDRAVEDETYDSVRWKKVLDKAPGVAQRPR